MNFKFLLVCLFAYGALVSCGGNKSTNENADKDDTPGIADAIQGMKSLSKLSEAASDIERVQKKLQGLTPLSNEEIKAVFGENIGEMKRTRFSVGSGEAMGINMGEAEYTDDQGKRVSLTLMDGAGETGSSMVAGSLMALKMDREEETETGFSKTTKINGEPASIKENKGDGWLQSEIVTVIDERYLVTISSSDLELKELEKVFQQLDLKKLK